ncbi:MAG: PH domain-containing protein [Candidatus Doudnabacteria bacterium]|nr:PH domain-containing protein [Candidatus Doudnabacteria bacterium]
MEEKNKIIFPGQQSDERVCLIIRQHWLVLFMKLFLWFIMLIVYFVLDYVSLTFLPQYLDRSFLPLIDLLKIGYLMFMALGLLIIITLWYLNTHIITSKRVVDVEQKSLLTHTISELHLEQIQDVTAEVHGLFENIFNFGDVYVQTAGETQRFLFNKIPNPTKVTKLLIDLYEALPDQQKRGHP